jgi:hypothetical protein
MSPMRCFAQIKDGSGRVWIRWEDDIKHEGDLAGLVSATLDLFRKEFPGVLLMTDVNAAGSQFAVEFGKA